MAISRKVKVQEPRIEKTDPLARTLFASPLGATGVERQPLPSRARVGNGWGERQATSGTEASRISFIPPQGPLTKRWGLAGGIEAGAARPCRRKRNLKGTQVRCGRKALRFTGHDRKAKRLAGPVTSSKREMGNFRSRRKQDCT